MSQPLACYLIVVKVHKKPREKYIGQYNQPIQLQCTTAELYNTPAVYIIRGHLAIREFTDQL